MKRLVLLVILFFILTGCKEDMQDPYGEFGAPSEAAAVFAKGMISMEDQLEYSPTFLSDYSRFYFGSREQNGNPVLMEVVRNSKGEWEKALPISFTGQAEMEAMLSPDGQTLFFSAVYDESFTKPHDLFCCHYKDQEWSDPIRLPDTVNSSAIEYYATSTMNGTLYFTREGDGIYRSEWDGEQYLNAEKVEEFQEYYYASHPYIAPDESYLLFDARHSSGLGSADIYISFMDENGHFDAPINLGGLVNSSGWDAMPSLSPDQSVLFFVREDMNDRDIYWVSFGPDQYK